MFIKQPSQQRRNTTKTQFTTPSLNFLKATIKKITKAPMVYQSRAQGQFRNLHRRNEATRSMESRGKGTERRKRSSISAEATESSSRRNNCLQFHHRTNSRRHRSPAAERNIECLRLERIAGVAGGEGRARQDHLDGILAGPLAESRSSLVEAQRFNELANRNRFPATNHLTRERERKKGVYS